MYANDIQCDTDQRFKLYLPLQIKYVYCVTGCDHGARNVIISPSIYSIDTFNNSTGIIIAAIRPATTNNHTPETVLYGRFSFICV